MPNTPTKEYLCLFNAMSEAITAIRRMTVFRVLLCATTANEIDKAPREAAIFLLANLYDDIEVLQKLQKFLVDAQCKAEKLYIESDSAP